MSREEITYEQVIGKLEEKLPSLPQILDELIKALGNFDVTLDLIQEMIEIDQSISLEILKVVNKVEFLEPEESRITSIHDAMHKLGFENVQKIILNVSALPIFTDTTFPAFFKVESLWKHSVGVAFGCTVISDLIDYENSDKAYACGLMHDIGKVAKIKFDQRNFGRELLSAKRKEMSIHEMEVARNLLQHETLGSMIAEKWEMPEELTQSIRWHHTEEREKRIGLEDPDIHFLVDMVFLSNCLINKMQFGNSGHEFHSTPSPKLLRRLGLKDIGLAELEEQVRLLLEEKFSFLVLLK